MRFADSLRWCWRDVRGDAALGRSIGSSIDARDPGFDRDSRNYRGLGGHCSSRRYVWISDYNERSAQRQGGMALCDRKHHECDVAVRNNRSSAGAVNCRDATLRPLLPSREGFLRDAGEAPRSAKRCAMPNGLFAATCKLHQCDRASRATTRLRLLAAPTWHWIRVPEREVRLSTILVFMDIANRVHPI